MTQYRTNRRTARAAFCTAAAAALVVGYAGYGPAAMAGSSAESTVQVPKKDRKAVAKAEKAVAKAPQSVAARLGLASAYLRVGRFESAASTFEDAQALGDQSPATALSLSLAYVGAGQDRKAVAMLDQWRDSIPASDLGLALSLAGETGRGVSILSDELRGGDNSAKLRQNLAYAYALDGRWREARLMASQDVSPDALDARISDWAMQARPEDYRKRVSALLGVPLRSDVGQPAELALVQTPDTQVAAVAEPVATPVAPPAYTAYSQELPASDGSTDFYVAEAAKPEVYNVTVAGSADTSAPSNFDQAFAEPAPAPAPAQRFVSNPVVQSVPASKAAAPRTASVKATAKQQDVQVASLTPATFTRADDKDCTHMVQLGSFSSPENAERAWKIFLKRNPSLANFDKTITQAEVRGKNYWRVAAAGFDKSAALGLCSSIKGKGRGCIAYSVDKPLPGALPSSSKPSQRYARR
ncbi:MAG: SPOR domain-containing protein [Sphingomonadaceae bacterium]